MRNRQSDVLSATFHSRGYAFRIVGRSSGCPDTDDVARQLIAEAVQSLSLTKLKKQHVQSGPDLSLATDVAGSFNPHFYLEPVRHAVWRKLNRAATRVDRQFDRWLGDIDGA